MQKTKNNNKKQQQQKTKQIVDQIRNKPMETN